MQDVTAKSLQELPDELRQLAELAKQKRLSYLDDLAKQIAKKRDEAVRTRQESGIEAIWREDREFYNGVDDANRANHPYTKSMGVTGGLMSNTNAEKPDGCTAFFNITRQFVDSASARMGDILLPAGEWNFTIKPTAVPELEKLKDSTQPVVGQNGPIKNIDGSAYTIGQFSQIELKEIGEKAEKAEQQILDWLTDCNYHAEVRKVIDDAAQVGTGIIRGAYPTKKKSRVVKDGALQIIDKIIPSSRHVKPENFYPDPACNDNIQNGNYCIEKDALTSRQLRQLKGMPGYLDENIDKILKEGPSKSNVNEDGTFKPDHIKNSDNVFEVWYVFCDINLDDLQAFGIEEEKIARDAVPAIAIMVNDTLIKGILNPLDNGEFPYDVMAWQRQNGTIWGTGVARQGRTPQEMLNSSARALMNNMGLSAAPQTILRRSAIVPADGEWTLKSGKLWFTTEEIDIRSVSDAMFFFNVPSMQVELSNIIQMAYKMMEDATGVSFLLQGQQGSAPDTVGGMELLHRNSSSLLRRVARIFDESVTEPHIRRYYDWLLLNEDDDSMKGDLDIQAIGSSALVEREIQSQQAAQIVTMALNPVFEMSPKKAKDEMLRSWRFEPSKFDMDEEEKKAAAQRQPPPAPAVQVAQIRAENEQKITQAKFTHEQQIKVAELDHDEQMDKNDTDRDTAYVNAQTTRDKIMYSAKVEELRLKKELALLDYSSKNNMKLEDIKAGLAKTVMTLRMQKELSLLANRGKEVAKPVAEPPGRADNGQAFIE